MGDRNAERRSIELDSTSQTFPQLITPSYECYKPLAYGRQHRFDGFALNEEYKGRAWSFAISEPLLTKVSLDARCVVA